MYSILFRRLTLKHVRKVFFCFLNLGIRWPFLSIHKYSYYSLVSKQGIFSSVITVQYIDLINFLRNTLFFEARFEPGSIKHGTFAIALFIVGDEWLAFFKPGLQGWVILEQGRVEATLNERSKVCHEDNVSKRNGLGSSKEPREREKKDLFNMGFKKIKQFC